MRDSITRMSGFKIFFDCPQLQKQLMFLPHCDTPFPKTEVITQSCSCNGR